MTNNEVPLSIYLRRDNNLVTIPHVWAEMVASMLDDPEVPFVAASVDRDVRRDSEVVGLRHKSGALFVVSVQQYKLHSAITARNKYDGAATAAAVYEVYKTALLELASTRPDAWRGMRLWVEKWEYQVGMRRDRPLLAERLGKKRRRVRRD